MSGMNTSPDTPPSALPVITFGIELEGRFLPYGPADLRFFTLEDLAALLSSRSGLDVQLGDLGADSTYVGWEISADFSIAEVEGEGISFELKSPVLTCTKQSHVEIYTMIKSLHAIGTVFVDKSCGMHVHVGFGSFGYPLRTVQNLAAIVVGFEHLLATLHPDHRQDNDYASNPSDGFMVPDGAEVANLSAGHSRVAAIMMTTHWGALRQLLGGEGVGRGRAYNFQPTFPTYNSHHALKTVEFRQGAGTFDPEAICAWATVCTGIVFRASQASEAQLKRLFSFLAPTAGFDAANLLSKLDLAGPAHYYKTRLFERSNAVEAPLASRAGSALVNASIDMRPEVMQDIEDKHSMWEHRKIEAAVCTDGESYSESSVVWVPFLEHPYTMSYARMMDIAVSSEEAAFEARREQEEREEREA